MIKVANNLSRVCAKRANDFHKQAIVSTTLSGLLHAANAEPGESFSRALLRGSLKGLGADLGALTGYLGVGGLSGGVADSLYPDLDATSTPADALARLQGVRRTGSYGGALGAGAGGIGGYLLADSIVDKLMGKGPQKESSYNPFNLGNLNLTDNQLANYGIYSGAGGLLGAGAGALINALRGESKLKGALIGGGIGLGAGAGAKAFGDYMGGDAGALLRLARGDNLLKNEAERADAASQQKLDAYIKRPAILQAITSAPGLGASKAWAANTLIRNLENRNTLSSENTEDNDLISKLLAKLEADKPAIDARNAKEQAAAAKKQQDELAAANKEKEETKARFREMESAARRQKIQDREHAGNHALNTLLDGHRESYPHNPQYPYMHY